MRIYSKKVYFVGQLQFDSEMKAREWIFDQIGNLMDSALSKRGVGAIGPRERIAIVECMKDNAAQFAVLLDAISAKSEVVS